VSVPEISTPKSPSRQNSAEVNFRARFVRRGVKKARQMIPNTVPITEAARAMKIACAPCPAGPVEIRPESKRHWPRSGNPYQDGGEERRDAATYNPMSRAMAECPENLKVMPVSKAIPIVVVRPGGRRRPARSAFHSDQKNKLEVKSLQDLGKNLFKPMCNPFQQHQGSGIMASTPKTYQMMATVVPKQV